MILKIIIITLNKSVIDTYFIVQLSDRPVLYNLYVSMYIICSDVFVVISGQISMSSGQSSLLIKTKLFLHRQIQDGVKLFAMQCIWVKIK